MGFREQIISSMGTTINTERNPEPFMLYTLEEGGKFHYLGNVTKEFYEQVKKDGYFEVTHGTDRVKLYPKFIMHGVAVHSHDFIIDKLNARTKNS